VEEKSVAEKFMKAMQRVRYKLDDVDVHHDYECGFKPGVGGSCDCGNEEVSDTIAESIELLEKTLDDHPLVECYGCKETFVSENSDAAAQAEYEKDFPVDAEAGREVVVLCHECYEETIKRINAHNAIH
jgi:hypothetical protein